MRRFILIPMLVGAVALGCPGDKKVRPSDTAAPIDTTPIDLSNVQSNLPAAAPDTFRPTKRTGPAAGPAIPSAPPALMEAVQREQSFTRFCFQEKGQKADPSLRGNVAMIVTIGATGITAARVGDSNWSSASGKAVNACLNERAASAWRISPGAVKNGQYVVQLTFSG